MFLRLDAVNRHFTLSLQPVKVTVLRQDTQTLHYVTRKTDKEKKIIIIIKILRPTSVWTDYLFYSRACGTFTVSSLKEELWGNWFQINTDAQTNTQTHRRSSVHLNVSSDHCEPLPPA